MAAHDVIDVLTQARRVRPILACANAKLVRRDEVLLVSPVSLASHQTMDEVKTRTVHSWICFSPPNAVENTSPPIGFPVPDFRVSLSVKTPARHQGKECPSEPR